MPLESFATVAEILRVCPWSIAGEPLGDNVTEIGGGVVEPHPDAKKPANNPTNIKIAAENLFIVAP